ncbi:protein-disulfide reductase DsbD family protein [Nibricoccus sp. IMCC34717]|uniref:protein-disulfide reductase DsbD family protein n=1 Tax=Nibricoccus sp. IMCC34717 TaxID=3034021 RepID=UPI00384AC585
MRLFPLLALLFTLVSAAHAQVTARLVAADEWVQPGRPFTVALELTHEKGWHTYWLNAGTGYPTSLAWNLPTGWKAGEIAWPVPGKILDRLGAISGNGYDGVLLLPVIIDPGSARAGETVALRAKADWLMCAEQCIPGGAQVSLELPVRAEMPKPNADVRARLAAQPMPQGKAGSSATLGTGRIALRLPGTADWKDLHFFSTDGLVQYDLAQQARFDAGHWLVDLPVSSTFEGKPTHLDGVLAYADATGKRHGITVSTELKAAPLERWGASFWRNLGLAWVGGLILNLMPCVFPVIGIKILGFVNQAGADRRKVTLHGLAFAGGVLLSFWTLAGALALLRAGGDQLGWGFQLQSPAFVFGLAVLMLVFGLSMSGVFEFGLQATSVGSGLQSRSGLAGSFFSGVLATVVATPCSAPFLAPALGAALALPAAESFLLFTAIAVGLAMPYLLLSFFPVLVRALPRPGAWMETFKQAMAFPLYATVGYLMWVLAGQASDTSLRNALLALVVVAMGVWVYGRYHTFGAPPLRARLSLLGSAGLVAAGLWLGWPQPETVQWKPWSAEAVTQARAEKRTIYVDFTARWCATCQTNKQLVFHSDAVLDLLKERNVLLLKADWTNRDPAITAELARFGRSAVPFNLVYRPDRTEPAVLPELLTPSVVLEALR